MICHIIFKTEVKCILCVDGINQQVSMNTKNYIYIMGDHNKNNKITNNLMFYLKFNLNICTCM